MAALSTVCTTQVSRGFFVRGSFMGPSHSLAGVFSLVFTVGLDERRSEHERQSAGCAGGDHRCTRAGHMSEASAHSPPPKKHRHTAPPRPTSTPPRTQARQAGGGGRPGACHQYNHQQEQRQQQQEAGTHDTSSHSASRKHEGQKSVSVGKQKETGKILNITLACLTPRARHWCVSCSCVSQGVLHLRGDLLIQCQPGSQPSSR